MVFPPSKPSYIWKESSSGMVYFISYDQVFPYSQIHGRIVLNFTKTMSDLELAVSIDVMECLFWWCSLGKSKGICVPVKGKVRSIQFLSSFWAFSRILTIIELFDFKAEIIFHLHVDSKSCSGTGYAKSEILVADLKVLDFTVNSVEDWRFLLRLRICRSITVSILAVVKLCDWRMLQFEISVTR